MSPDEKCKDGDESGGVVAGRDMSDELEGVGSGYPDREGFRIEDASSYEWRRFWISFARTAWSYAVMA